MKHSATDLLDIIKDLIDAVEFDYDDCDFGPAYGMAIERRDDVLKRARKALKDRKDYEFLEERFEYVAKNVNRIRDNIDAVFKMEHPQGYRERLPRELQSGWHDIYGNFCLLTGILDYARVDKQKTPRK